MSRRPLIIGHRGASSHAPENTLAALRLAVEAGADGVEFDVRLSRDNVPVVIHDRDLRRVTGSGALVSELTASELGKTDVGSWFGHAFPGRTSSIYSKETVPSLRQVLELLSTSSGTIFLELKADVPDIRPLVERSCEVIRNSGLISRMIVKSFSLTGVELVKSQLPAVETAALFEPGVKTVFGRRSEMVRTAAERGASHISLHWSLVNRTLMETAGVIGMPVTVWTVNHPRWVTKAARLGVRSLITNDPQKLLTARDGSLSNRRM
jgi:glycerophosphoryl diester phosphodiesterase